MKTTSERIGNAESTLFFEDGLLMVTSTLNGRFAPTYYTKRHGDWVVVPYDIWIAEYNQLVEMGFN